VQYASEFTAPAATTATLERAWQVGRNAGLASVYVGNVPGHRHANTYCPGCGALLVERFGLDLVRNQVRDGQCPYCGEREPGIWEAASGTQIPSAPAYGRQKRDLALFLDRREQAQASDPTIDRDGDGRTEPVALA